jgi:probable rRNA maturation factor
MTPPLPASDPGEEPAEPPERLVLDIVVEDDAWLETIDVHQVAHDIASLISATPDLAVVPAATATVCFDTDAAVRALNGRFRAQDKPTNVLSFPNRGAHWGDVVLARETILAEAAAAGIAPQAHTTHLLLHGLLHLIGYDHETDADAVVMEALETRLLARLGIADPHAD